jgi:hypothetical protein
LPLAIATVAGGEGCPPNVTTIGHDVFPATPSGARCYAMPKVVAVSLPSAKRRVPPHGDFAQVVGQPILAVLMTLRAGKGDEILTRRPKCLRIASSIGGWGTLEPAILVAP